MTKMTKTKRKKINKKQMDILESAIYEFSEEEDNEGQIVLYTGWYHWTDGNIYDQPEEK